MSRLSYAPSIHMPDLPRPEAERRSFVERGLRDLGTYCEDLEAAVLLYQQAFAWVSEPLPPAGQPGHAERISENAMLGKWKFVAARDAANTIYRFSEAIEAIGTNLNKCPPLLAAIDSRAKRLATRTFRKHFPSYAGLRHSSVHTSQLYGTPEAMAEHEGALRMVVINSLIGHDFTSTFEGKTVQLALTTETIEKLREVRDLYWDVFMPFDRNLEGQRIMALATIFGPPV